MDDVLWRRLGYMLSPQLDLYQAIGPRLKDLDVLEVGFGTGLGTVQLAAWAASVRALELNPAAVTFARKTLPLRNVVWLEQDILQPRPASGKYHAAVMVEVLEHISDWRVALERVHDLLRLGGRLFISARNRNADLRNNSLHEREWTADEFKGALSEFFPDVRLYDYRLDKGVNETTRATPLIAVARKGTK